jgi:hypothetical protein
VFLILSRSVAAGHTPCDLPTSVDGQRVEVGVVQRFWVSILLTAS